jgi:hypothetical protein
MATAADFSDDFPEEITTLNDGVLHLKVTGLAWTEPDGEERVLKACSYRSDDSRIAFNVDESKPPDVEQWLRTFENRAREFKQHWREILLNQEDSLREQIENWLPERGSVRALLESIELKGLSVGDDGSVSLAFGTVPLLRHHDLGIELDPDNVVRDVIIEG